MTPMNICSMTDEHMFVHNYVFLQTLKYPQIDNFVHQFVY